MDLPAFVESRFEAKPYDPGNPTIAYGLLALDAVRVSELIEQWRGIGNRVLPLTYAEFCAVLSGDLRPSDSIQRTWQRLPLYRYRPDDAVLKERVAERRDDLFAFKTVQYENEARRILIEFAGHAPSPWLYAKYLKFAGTDAQDAFFRKWAMPFPEQEGVAHHGYIAAGSGFGKSELIKAFVFERVRRGEGVFVLDPHGSMVQQIARWPEVARSGKLVYIDPYINGPTAGITPVINPLSPLKTNPYKDAAVSYLIECLQRVVGQMELTQRMETLLRHVLPGLAHKDQPTLMDLMDVMAPRALWKKPTTPGEAAIDPTNGVLDFVVRHTWENGASHKFMTQDFPSAGYDNTREAIRGRLHYLLASLTFQHCVMGSPDHCESTINLRKEIDRGAIILVNLSSKAFGKPAADLGKFLLASLFSAAMSRQDVPEHMRKNCYAYLDEADAFLNESVKDIYAEARKYGLFLTVAQQVPGSGMSGDIESQVFGNSSIRIAGNSGDPASINLLAKLTRSDESIIQDLRKGEFLFYTASNSGRYRAWVRRDLKGFSHSISNDEWEQVKAEQISRYYRDHLSRSEKPTFDARNPDL